MNHLYNKTDLYLFFVTRWHQTSHWRFSSR